MFVTCEHIQRVRCLHKVPQATLVRGLIVPRLAQVDRRQWRPAPRLSVLVFGREILRSHQCSTLSVEPVCSIQMGARLDRNHILWVCGYDVPIWLSSSRPGVSYTVYRFMKTLAYEAPMCKLLNQCRYVNDQIVINSARCHFISDRTSST